MSSASRATKSHPDMNYKSNGSEFWDQDNEPMSMNWSVSYTGIKDYVPPYLDWNLSIVDLITGVSFASAGSGFDPLTPLLSNVVSLPMQLEYFKEYRRRLEGGRGSFTASAFQQFLIQQIKWFIQGLWSQGARRIAVVGLPPMGCLPIMITLISDRAAIQRDCKDQFSSVARDYNSLLQAELRSMQVGLAAHGARIYYADIYGPLFDMVRRSDVYGFVETSNGCCGTGLLEASFLCNPKTFVCSDVSKYVFWDSIHPTERTYYLLFKELRPVVDHIISDE
ncbi:hypothetical protein MLD38_016736 [Melastoma candidum]|uniref:Uncharacterized protein n=1 Tax=Melastoma candidum TaxID=119954 RepID=A0ACB9QND9_9MYRT|nr:hypothetical protein MLD38_016736 [Melastoma candidum]